MNVNSVTIVGRLTRDPELKALPSGSNVANMSLATSRSYTDKDGKLQEETEYHNVVIFGKSAENVAKYLVKGALACVEGRLQTRSWDKDGVKQYRTEILADRVQFGPKPTGESVVRDDSVLPDYPADEINPDDIAF
jgi:single-strand DNA-binding protein